MSSNPFDYVIRFIESTAFIIHSILGITELCTGCLRAAFQDKGAMPLWFWPVAGILLAVVAYLNFSDNNKIVLGVQAYIAAFHCGAIFYHLRLKHHPAAGLAPGVFVLFAMIVLTLRTNLLIAALITAVCAFVAYLLSLVLVTPLNPDEDEALLSSNVAMT